MACGTPVVAPAGRPYDEFAHGIAFEVDPRDPDSIARGMQRAVAAGIAARRRAPAAADFTLGARRAGRMSTSTGSSPHEAAVAIDADVLGRRRTGDETYVAALLRELAPIADEERLAAVTRHPGARARTGIEPVELPARSQPPRMAASAPARYCGGSARRSRTSCT